MNEPFSSASFKAAPKLYRVLLVDDDPSFFAPVRRVIEEVRPEAIIVYASNAATAVWQIEATALCLVITDMQMQSDPIAGWQVVEAAQKAHVPVVVTSGYVNDAERDRLVGAGVTVLAKTAMNLESMSAILNQAFAT